MWSSSKLKAKGLVPMHQWYYFIVYNFNSCNFFIKKKSYDSRLLMSSLCEMRNAKCFYEYFYDNDTCGVFLPPSFKNTKKGRLEVVEIFVFSYSSTDMNPQEWNPLNPQSI